MDGVLFPDCALPDGVVAFFTTRAGGVSAPPYNAFNLSTNVGDEATDVAENRARLMRHLPNAPKWLRQVHSGRVVAAEEIADEEVADASYTIAPDTVCAIQTADCLPVLLYHADGRGVAAAHAGWRGIAAGVLQNTVTAMREKNKCSLAAFIGPAISAPNYVIGEETRRILCQVEGDEEAFSPAEEAGKWRADLPLLAMRRLRAAGVSAVRTHNRCTFAEPAHFFSARRDGVTGRQAAVIYIRSR